MAIIIASLIVWPVLIIRSHTIKHNYEVSISNVSVEHIVDKSDTKELNFDNVIKYEEPKVTVKTQPQTIVSSSSSKDVYDEIFKREVGEDWRTMKAICQAESGFNNVRGSMNKNGTYDHGICQINDIHVAKVDGDIQRLYDPETNIKVAAQIYREWHGFSAWSVYKSGKYKKYL